MTPEDIPHVLACDVGNTAIRLAHVQGKEVLAVRRLGLDELSRLGAAVAELWREMPSQKKLAAASVNPAALSALEAAAGGVGQDILVVGRDLPLPMETDLPHPEQAGTDRLCAAAAAFDQLGVACVVADFGTAVTIDCVSEEGVFLGGVILPGIGMGAEALHDRTAQLPQVEPVDPDWVFGRDTRQAIIGGLIRGARGALREMVEVYATQLGHWPLVVLAGGDAALVCPDPSRSELVQAVVPDLVLRGVAIAYYRSLLK